jgi:hypothetical protein
MRFAVIILALLALGAGKVRAVPVVVSDEKGNVGFTWGHTADQRPIKICFAAHPIPAQIRCYINTGQDYEGTAIEQIVPVEVVLVNPPLEM